MIICVIYLIYAVLVSGNSLYGINISEIGNGVDLLMNPEQRLVNHIISCIPLYAG